MSVVASFKPRVFYFFLSFVLIKLYRGIERRLPVFQAMIANDTSPYRDASWPFFTGSTIESNSTTQGTILNSIMFNSTGTKVSSNLTMMACQGESTLQAIAYFMCPIMLITCLVAMCVNMVVFASVHWVRSPMTPNLKISLSLALADACSSSTYGLLIAFDYLPSSWTDSILTFAIVEIARLSGIVITVVHLLALAINHYIGILKPLHYNSIVTSRKVTAVIIMLWICPTITVIAMCLALDTDRALLMNLNLVHHGNNNNIPLAFMKTFRFRIILASLFYVPIFIMVVCYVHILFVVKKQQNRWNNLSRMGSTRFSGQVSRNSNGSQRVCRERRQLEGNIKAIYTTLWILGSCFIGWGPALLIYVTMCEEGCPLEGQAVDDLNCTYPTLIAIIRTADNVLVLAKMLANPIIYSARMKEIKDGTHRMYLAMLGLCCPSRRDAILNSGYYRPGNLSSCTGPTGTIPLRLASLRRSKHITKNGLTTKESENTFL